MYFSLKNDPKTAAIAEDTEHGPACRAWPHLGKMAEACCC
jgi:hypothetical protein